jgi:hypothetical protein
MRKSIVFCMLVVAAMLGIAGLFGGYVRAAAVTLIQNIDEPARTPYQETIALTGGCDGGGDKCVYKFNAIPSGHRLRITYGNCLFFLNDPNGISWVGLLSADSDSAASVALPTTPYGNTEFVAAGAELTLYVNAGHQSVMVLATNTGAVTDQSSCTIAGYLVAL